MKRLQGRELDFEEGKLVISKLRAFGITKINFVGGEPFLHKHLVDFIDFSKSSGLTVSIVTNASLLNERTLAELRGVVDWIGASVDSARESTELELGRGHGNHVELSRRACEAIRKAEIRLKVNTVVTKLNFREDMRPLIADLRPRRWKVFQMLPIRGQNDSTANYLAPTAEEFGFFRRTNGNFVLESGSLPVFESSEDMIDSYLMLAPDGSVIKNSGHEYQYVPLDQALNSDLSSIINAQAYFDRGGVYEW